MAELKTSTTLFATYKRTTDNFIRYDINVGGWKDKKVSGQIYIKKGLNLTELKIKLPDKVKVEKREDGEMRKMNGTGKEKFGK